MLQTIYEYRYNIVFCLLALIILAIVFWAAFIRKTEKVNDQPEPDKEDDNYIDFDTGTRVKVIHTKKKAS